MRFLILSPLLFLFVESAVAHVTALSTPKRNCFSTHVVDAIQLNKERRSTYSQATQGRSLAISDELISFEKSMQSPALLVDTWARLFQAQGINIICNELVEIDKTPALPAELPLSAKPNLENYKSINIKSLQKKLNLSLEKGFSQLAIETKNEIQLLKDEPRFNCITRHFLESIFVFTRNGQEYLNQVSRFQKSNLHFFLKRMILAHIDYLEKTYRLDFRAKQLQTEGFPILCQDVPHIEID